MKPALKSVAIVAAVAGSLGGCATPETSNASAAVPAATDCVQSTGSSICRKSGADTSNVKSVSGDDFRTGSKVPGQ